MRVSYSLWRAGGWFSPPPWQRLPPAAIPPAKGWTSRPALTPNLTRPRRTPRSRSILPDPHDASDAATALPKPDGGTGPCAALAPAPLFCDDFEDGELEDDWDVLNVSSGGSATLEVASFAARTKAVAAQDTAFAHLRTTVLGKPSHVRLSFFAFFPVTTLSKGALAIATVDVSQSHFFTLFLRDADPDAPGPTLEETIPGTTSRHVLGSPPPANTWTRIVVDLDLTTGKASVTWDGTKALDGAAIATSPAPEDPTIRVGALYVYGPQDPFEGRFDDVLFESL